MKKSLADRIEQYINVLIERSEEDLIEIQRAELAETFKCAPSQVTYVIGTRFTDKEGYITESRRGGKGYVRISRCKIRVAADDYLRKLLEIIDEIIVNKNINQEQISVIRCLVTTAFGELSAEEKKRIFRAVRLAMDDYEPR